MERPLVRRKLEAEAIRDRLNGVVGVGRVVDAWQPQGIGRTRVSERDESEHDEQAGEHAHTSRSATDTGVNGKWSQDCRLAHER